MAQPVTEALDQTVTYLILDLHHNLFTQHHQDTMPVAVEEVKIIEKAHLQVQVVQAEADLVVQEQELQEQLVQQIPVAEEEDPHVVTEAVEQVDQELF